MSKDKKQQEASKKIAEKLEQIQTLYRECAEIAEEAEVDFSFEGPEGTYGTGGWYSPKSAWQPSSGCEWEESGEEGSDYGWCSSSSSC